MDIAVSGVSVFSESARESCDAMGEARAAFDQLSYSSALGQISGPQRFSPRSEREEEASFQEYQEHQSRRWRAIHTHALRCIAFSAFALEAYSWVLAARHRSNTSAKQLDHLSPPDRRAVTIELLTRKEISSSVLGALRLVFSPNDIVHSKTREMNLSEVFKVVPWLEFAARESVATLDAVAAMLTQFPQFKSESAQNPLRAPHG